MAKLNFLRQALTLWFNAGNQYRMLKANDEKREKSVRLGVISIICSVGGAVLGALFLWGLIVVVGAMTSGDIGGALFFGILGLLLCIMGIIASLLQGLFAGLQYMIYQRKLNKRGIGTAALIVWIVSMVGCVVVAILLAAMV